MPKHIKLAYLPALGSVRLRLSGIGEDEAKLEQEIQIEIDKILPLIQDIFVGYQDNTEGLELIISKQLTQKGQTLALAESCTGGKLAEQFTSHSGASAFFKGAIVSYATQTKIDVLDVPEDLINRFSVVSSEVAKAMATNVRKKMNSDFAIATTGNAGPTKGDSDAEVGTVFIAIATKNGVEAHEFTMGNHRERVINKTVNKALELLQKEIFKN